MIVGSDRDDEGICVLCDPGEEWEASTQSCVACAVAWYKDTEGNGEACAQVPPGHYPDLASGGARGYYPCGVGKMEDGQRVCVDCANGRFQNATGQSMCHLCKDGWVAGRGQTKCEKCSSGTFAGGFWSAHPEFPSQGLPYAVKNVSQSSEALGGREGACHDCPVGFYADDEGQTFCKTCRKGQSSRAELERQGYPTEGDLGRFRQCDDCPAGKPFPSYSSNDMLHLLYRLGCS